MKPIMSNETMKTRLPACGRQASSCLPACRQAGSQGQRANERDGTFCHCERSAAIPTRTCGIKKQTIHQ